MTINKHQPIVLPDDWAGFVEWASSEADGCVSVGGLAHGNLEIVFQVEQT